MKIDILTIHCMHNPGSVFQAYALQKYLSDKYETRIIDYRPEYLYSENSNWKFALKKLLFGKEYKSRAHKFDSFIFRELKLSDYYKSYDELKNANFEADVYMTGSDQLWNSDFPCGNDGAYYLDFVKTGKKVAYSTSVGKKDIDAHNLQILKEKLPSFSAISVREKTNAEFLASELRRDIAWVCDPVFLLPVDQYMQFINRARAVSEPYVVVYMSGASELLSIIVDYYRQKGFKIILAGGFTKRCYCDIHLKDVGPEDFLSIIYEAEVVVSSSYHATAFCHIFHKDFVTLIPSKNGERIINLLNVSGLRNRGIEDDFEPSVVSIPINWHDVDEKLNNYISDSKKFLDMALGE